MPTKILVVDDEPDLELLITMSFSDKIKNNEYAFSFAGDGVVALEKLNADPEIGVVLTDINMPRMDGLTLLGKINEHHPLMRTVIVSAYGDMSNIRTALNRGAFDFVTKPIDLEDLALTLDKTVKEALERKAAILDRERLLRIDSELEFASQIQATILPRKFPPFPERKELDIHATMLPARQVGGDFYDFFFIDDHRLGFVVGDVSGKGMPAAMFMAVSRTFLKATATTGLSPRDCLERINRSLYQESSSQMFVTMFYGILDTRNGEVRYSNGGHNLPYVLRKDGKLEQTEMTDGIVLGAFEAARYKEKELELQPGDALFIYTDGVNEAMDPQDEEYTEARIEQCLSGLSGKSAEAISNAMVADVRDFAAGAPQSDDLTILVVKYNG